MSKLTDFLPGLAPDLVLRVARTSNVQITAASKGNFIDITSGTFTQAFAAAAALGNGWHCYIRNSGSGNITIPSSDGRTNWIMYPGEMRLFLCDGSMLRSIVITPFYTAFTSSGNFIKPPGYSVFEGKGWGGGAGGAGGVADSQTRKAAWSGGGAAGASFRLEAAKIALAEPVVIGAGGIGGAGQVGNRAVLPGADGGASTFAGITFNGGKGTSAASNTGGEGGKPDANRTLDGVGFPGFNGAYRSGSGSALIEGCNGGDGALGEGAGGAGGAAVQAGEPGGDGVAPGGGGGSATQVTYIAGVVTMGKPGGNGARGEVRIWGVI